MDTPRRRVPGWALFLLLVVMPLVELFVLVRVGRVIGAGWTILLLLASAVVGAWLVRREGSRAWSAFTGALGEGRVPAREIADGVLVLVGGVLMMAPGFVSDVVGLVLVLPFTRLLVRPVVVGAVASRLGNGLPPTATGPLGGFGFPGGFPGTGTDPREARHPGPQDDGPVVRGEVVDD